MRNLVRGSIVAFLGAAALLAAYASLSGPPPDARARPTAPASHSSRATGAPAAMATEPSDCGACVVAATADCDFCRYAVDPEAVDPVAADPGQPRQSADDDGYATALADFGEGPAPTGLAVFEPNAAVPAPVPEISTVAMAALGIVMLTTRARRRARASWKTAWMNPPLA